MGVGAGAGAVAEGVSRVCFSKRFFLPSLRRGGTHSSVTQGPLPITNGSVPKEASRNGHHYPLPKAYPKKQHYTTMSITA